MCFVSQNRKKARKTYVFTLPQNITEWTSLRLFLSTTPLHIWLHRMTIDVWTLNESGRAGHTLSHTTHDVLQTNTTCILFGTWEYYWALGHKGKRWICVCFFVCFILSFVLFATFSRTHCVRLLRIMMLCLFMIFRGGCCCYFVCCSCVVLVGLSFLDFSSSVHLCSAIHFYLHLFSCFCFFPVSRSVALFNLIILFQFLWLLNFQLRKHKCL